MTFNENTPKQIRDILTAMYFSRRRVRIWYGDVETGRSWNEEFDIKGIVGRSTGEKKVPLLIATTRSLEGSAILDHCIIRIDDMTGRKTLYKHPNFHTDLVVSFDKVIDERKSVIVARFDHPFQARKYFEFMEGKRYSK